jgi:23S rRNA (adenine2503-C2)-methyltransferase
MSIRCENSLKVRFFNLLPDEFVRRLAEWKWPKFRANQITKWVYENLATNPDLMTNLSKRDREELKDRVCFADGEVVRSQVSSDGTRKLLIQWPDGNSAETVLIPDGDRQTVCLSSQRGCPVGCRFCASGMNGLGGNLSAGQIVEQVFAINKIVGQPVVNHIVMMGMGEPLANYDQVIKAIRILHDPLGFNIGARKITLSTIGIPQKIKLLAQEGLPINLAISLHAAHEGLRRELIPWAKNFPLTEVLDAARYYFDKTGREITLEYILLSAVNDRPTDARELVKVCRTLRANVNLIRYNPVEGLEYNRPTDEAVMRFQEILREGGVNAHVRKSRGSDIDAACGQLRRREELNRRET